MSRTSDELRDRLLNADALDPQRQQRLETQVRELVSQRIRGIRWVYWILVLIGCAFSTWFFARGLNLLMTHPPAEPAGKPGPSAFAFLMLCEHVCLWLSALATGVVLYFLIRRRVDSRLQLRLGKIMPAGAFVLLIISFFYGMDDPVHKPEATWFGVYALAAFAFTSSVNLWNRVVAADHHAQERLLRIEYRLAELTERLPLPAPKEQQAP